MVNKKPSLSLYMHWPFCTSICPYCDFNVHINRSSQNYDWFSAYAKDINHAAHLHPQGTIQTIFLGGGTPSLMPPSLIETLINKMDQKWGITKNAEVTLEANPVDMSKKRLHHLKSAGITRLSLGVQSLRDDVLKFLGRTHTALEAQKTYEYARDIFDFVSLDLIYAYPNQTCIAWQEDLEHILTLAPTHLSAYQLTIEEHTPFHRLFKAGKLTLPSEEIRAELYEITYQFCQGASLEHYEISNYSRYGHACRHNIACWQGEDYIGIGAGAHGRITMDGKRYATQGIKSPKKWLKNIQEQGHGLEHMTCLTEQERQDETLLFGLRLSQGIAYQKLSQLGIRIDSDKKDFLIANNLLHHHPDYLMVTQQGKLVLDKITYELLL